MIWRRKLIVSCNSICVQIISSTDAISRKYRLDPSQYHTETEAIVRLCKGNGISLIPLKETGFFQATYLPNRFSRQYTRDMTRGYPMIGTSSMLNMKLPQDIRIFLSGIRQPEKLFIKDGDILISRSGTVGTCNFCGKSYTNFIASDDCIRLRIKPNYQGYVAAYIMSRYGQALLSKDAHGKVIKHLKPEDVEYLSIMIFDAHQVEEINRTMVKAKDYYDQSRALLMQVDLVLSETFNNILPREMIQQNNYGIIQYNSLRCGRLDPHMYDSYANYLINEISRGEHKLLGDITQIWAVPRFKRHYLSKDNPNSTPLFSSSDIIRSNISASKFISTVLNAKSIDACRVKKDYLLIPCSGAYGGILGKGILAGKLLDGQAVSQHVLRINRLTEDLNFYYVSAFLSSYQFGYPLITATRFGKDIPELDPSAIKRIPIPVIAESAQREIGDLFVQARDLQEKANELENYAINKLEQLFETSSV